MTKSMMTTMMGGAAAALLLAAATPAAAQTRPAPNPNKLRICAGSETGNYTFAATEIGKRIGQGVFRDGVDVLTTKGSRENLDKLAAGECDMAFAQSDVRALWAAENPADGERAVIFNGQLYTEYLHLLCPAAREWGRVNDIGKAAQAAGPGQSGARIAVGEPGSGTAESWRALRQTDPGLYDKVERLPLPPGRTTLAQVRNPNSTTCMLWISGLNSADMRWANDMSVNNQEKKPSMRLLDVNDRDMIAHKGRGGQNTYGRATIAKQAPLGNNPGLYHNLIPGRSVDTLTVNAELVTTQAYQDALGGRRSDALITAVDDALPSIHARTGPAPR